MWWQRANNALREHAVAQIRPGLKDRARSGTTEAVNTKNPTDGGNGALRCRDARYREGGQNTGRERLMGSAARLQTGFE